MPGSGTFSMRYYVPLSFIVLLALLCPLEISAGDEQPVFLGSIDVSPVDGGQDKFEIRLFHREDNRQLASHLADNRSYETDLKKGYIAITSRQYSFPRNASPGKIEPSFLSDFDLPLFSGLRGEIIARYGNRPTDDDLIRYVNGYIEKKNYKRGFDVASRVAERKEGDCSEHALLLVTLMRMFKIPAKVVMGVKTFELEGRYSAFGHAWVEYVYKGGWKAADPTLLTNVDHTYIPVGVLENEGMDYGVGLIALIQRIPYRIELAGM